ncbi:DUF1614 domain-containing protein [Marinobacterium jannaschii]|uniref:DUF1614 domain-containing protein n=1 Tax=Marinobacterium jannaschii TaxID=64970 RepID=UPI0006865A57|nr:DUF1614 domain-containing protein [Marinobacterium jannaschii]
MSRYLNHALTLLLFLIFFHLGAIQSVLAKLQLSQQDIAIAMLFATLGSLLSIQLFSLDFHDEGQLRLGINLGGALVPLGFVIYLIHSYPVAILPTLLLTLCVTLVVYPLTRVERRRGFVVYIFGAVFCSALGVLLIDSPDYLVQAYIAAVLGTLIGGDLMHLPQLNQLKARNHETILIGGGGLLDAVFLSGLLAMFTAEALRLHGYA